MNDAAVIDEPIEAAPPAPLPRRIAYRHRLPTRLWHWINALTVFVMLMSGLMIFNAHPHLYWGQYGLNFPTGDAALRYNILQKLSYVGVIFVLLPLMVLTGLTMSPALDAAWPWLLSVFGGRQSARSIHFICAALLLGFILVHLTMVLLAGPMNEIGSMITGRFRVPPDRSEEG